MKRSKKTRKEKMQLMVQQIEEDATSNTFIRKKQEQPVYRSKVIN